MVASPPMTSVNATTSALRRDAKLKRGRELAGPATDQVGSFELGAIATERTGGALRRVDDQNFGFTGHVFGC
jgi:hypothetical protein